MATHGHAEEGEAAEELDNHAFPSERLGGYSDALFS
jgi:hypothetical protein